MTLYDELITFSRASFRDFYKKFIYIECRVLLDEMFPKELDDSITGLIAYCYIDRTEGLSFRPIMMASLDAETLEVRDFPNADNTIYILRLRDEAIKMSEMHEGDAHVPLFNRPC